jgi:hypothetical protein
MQLMQGKNHTSYWKGKHFSEEHKRKLSESHKEISLSEEHKRNISEALKGKKNPMYGKHYFHTEEWKKEMSNRISGKGNPLYGKPHTDEHKRKISESKKGKYNYNIRNEKHPLWKGEEASIVAIHTWVRLRKHKPEACEMCNNFEPKHLSNVTGEYKRDVNDFQWLCRSCHMMYDNQIREGTL